MKNILYWVSIQEKKVYVQLLMKIKKCFNIMHVKEDIKHMQNFNIKYKRKLEKKIILICMKNLYQTFLVEH